ncbi:hypothetical protein ACTI_20520 [Actinoplanes sp. OR16]|nr:hypothetical protein ACTI_20520 [Actinoplanes sp. OR16]
MLRIGGLKGSGRDGQSGAGGEDSHCDLRQKVSRALFSNYRTCSCAYGTGLEWDKKGEGLWMNAAFTDNIFFRMVHLYA